MYVRKTTTDPSFLISVSEASYDNLRYMIMTNGVYYEHLLTAAFTEILVEEKDPFVLDIGSNVGWYGLYAAAGYGATVAAVDANPIHLHRMCESVKLNGVKTMKMFAYGVSDQPGTLEFRIPKGMPGAATFSDTIETRKAETNDSVQTQVITMDMLSAEQKWLEQPRIAIMKVDVEALEPQVLKGATKLLQSGIVKNIFLEDLAMDGDGKSNGEELWSKRETTKILTSFGYRLYKHGFNGGPNMAVPDDAPMDYADQFCSKRMCNLWWKLKSE